MRLTHMIDALLKYSRLEQQELPRQRFNVRDMIYNLVNDRLASGQINDRTVHIDLPFSELYGEPVSVRQALANLFDNAVKFSRSRPDPDIRISGTEGPMERVIRIADNGIGIEDAQTEKIFGLFERLHGPDDYEGTGVGLAIVKLVMDKHQGRAWVESTPGKGSTFVLSFPHGNIGT
jgi:signal transduction histidine kinase